MNPFQSLRDYETYVYTLQKQFVTIAQSTLVLLTRGSRVAVLQGELFFFYRWLSCLCKGTPFL